ncbi:MAG: hypothetical protein JNK05_34260 [Myxococcales bacterium]|nr:hypothetical protein [Myxococcales bacterium]
MSRTPLDPTLLGADSAQDARDHALLSALVEGLTPRADVLATDVFVREIGDALDAEAHAAIAAVVVGARDKLDFSTARANRTRAILAVLDDDERAAIAEHAREIASTLARAWIDLWSRAAAESEGALRIERVAPPQEPLARAWDECAAQLGLDRAEADSVLDALLGRVRREGLSVELPLGLRLDGRASDLWIHHSSQAGALPDEIARSGAQLRGPAISLDEARKRRGG